MHLDTLFGTGAGSGTLVSPRQLRGGLVWREGVSPFAQPFGGVWEELEILQLEPGGGRSRVEHVQGGEVFISREECPCKIFASGRVGRGRFGICVPLGAPGSAFAGQVLEEGFAASAIHGEDIRFAAQAGSRHLVVVVDHARLVHLALQSGPGAGVARLIRDGRPGGLLRVRGQAVKPLERLLDAVAEGQPGMEVEALERLVYGAVLALIEPDQQPSGSSSTVILFRRALEHADMDPGMPKISGLAKALHVSPRTLHKAFQMVAGIGPAGFFLKRQLHRARMSLLEADVPQAKISVIAKSLGITELGRFAVRYRAMFGESPSATLRRVRRRA